MATPRSTPATASLVVVSTLLLGCQPFAGQDETRHRTVLATRTTAGTSWTLSAEDNGHGLCLSLTGPESPEAVWSGACGFGPDGSGRGNELVSESATGVAPDGTPIVYGPAPAAAVAVRLTPQDVPATPTGVDASSGERVPLELPGCRAKTKTPVLVRITERLPAWTKPGGWFLAQPPDSGCVYDVTFLDKDGKPLEQSRFF